MFKNYFKIAFRNFSRNKAFTFINILGLAIGMAVCIMLLLWVQNELSYDKFHENEGQIYNLIQEGIWNDGQIYGNRTIPYRLAPLMHEIYPEVKNHVRLRTANGMMMQVGDKTFYQDDVLLTESALFEMFSFDLIKGDLEVAFKDKYNLILTEDTAAKYFGDEDPIGQVIRYNDQIDFTVSGITANPPTNSSIYFDMIIPFEIIGKEKRNGWSWESQGYVQLFENTNIEAFKEKIRKTIAEHNDGENFVRIQPLSKVHLYNPLDTPVGLIFVLIFAAIGIIVLLIACINFMNLSTARSANRAKEVGIRKVVGADRRSLIKQFLSESILTAFLALIIAFVLVELFLPAFNNLAHKELIISFSNLTFIAGLVIITLLVGLISGSYPAFYLSHFIPSKVLKSGSGSKDKNRFRTILVVIQFTISIALIICTATVYNQLKYIQNKDLGFSKEFIVSVPMNTELDGSFVAFKEEMMKNPNILGVTNSSSSPANVGNVNPAVWEGKTDDENILFNFFLVEKDFLDVFKMELVKGHNFTKNKQQNGEYLEFIVNEAAVELMQMEDPIGKRFMMYDEKNAGEIIGVVKDYHFKNLTNDIGPIMITTLNWWRGSIFIKINPQNVPESLEYIEEIVTKFSPSFPYEFSFLDEDIDQQYSQYYEMGNIIKYFAILAVFISCLGLFGLASFITEQRTKEIGIRKVLGSSVAKIIYLLTKGFSKWVLLSNVFAWPIAYYAMQKFLELFAYKSGFNIWIFIISGFSALLVSILTVSYQTLRAANANPVKALKYE
jgi:putative ABC transport system permease protein